MTHLTIQSSLLRVGLGLAGLGLAACGGGEVLASAGGSALPADTPIVLVVIDTLRADRLGAYGCELGITPNLDALARSAYVFEQNATQCNSTYPSITSIMTGLYPRTHRNYVPVPVEGSIRVGAEHTALAERLTREGYRCYGVVSHPSWNEAYDAPVYRGWERLSLPSAEGDFEERIRRANAADTNERVFALLDEYVGGRARGDEAPLMLWAHYFDPHTDEGASLTYHPPAEYRSRFLRPHLEAAGLGAWYEEFAARDPDARSELVARIAPEGEEREAALLANGRALYDGEVAYTDHEVGRLFERLKALGLWDDALVVVVADHGENMEYVESHGWNAFTHKRLYEGVARVPLLVKLPGQVEGRRVPALSQSVDLVPTVHELLGLGGEEAFEGRSLVPLLEDPGAVLHDTVYFESSDNSEKGFKTAHVKYIAGFRGQSVELYRWTEDPGEERNLASEVDPRRVAACAEVLRAFRPRDVIHLRLEPDAAPYELEFEYASSRARVVQAVGWDLRPAEAPGAAARWRGTVDDEAVELTLVLEHLATESRFSFRGFDGRDVAERLHAGARPMRETRLLPVWSAADAPAPAAPAFARAEVAGSGPADVRASFSFAPGAEPAGATELELRYRTPAYRRTFEVLTSEGFGAPALRPGNVVRLTAPAAERASVVLGLDPQGGEVLALPRLDGAWPGAAEIALGPRAADPERLTVVVPLPGDLRITSALSLAPEPGSLPPGAVSLWIESGSVELAIDAEELDGARAAELRTLGYVR